MEKRGENRCAVAENWYWRISRLRIV